MDEKRLCTVDFLDVGFGNTGLEVEDCVGVEAENATNTW
jgi:hypothetical protein